MTLVPIKILAKQLIRRCGYEICPMVPVDFMIREMNATRRGGSAIPKPVLDSIQRGHMAYTYKGIPTFKVEKALGHRDVGDIGAPHLIDPLDCETG